MQVYSVQFDSHLATAGEFLIKFINKHPGFPRDQANYHSITWSIHTQTFLEFKHILDTIMNNTKDKRNISKMVFKTNPNTHALLDPISHELDNCAFCTDLNTIKSSSTVSTIIIPYVNKHFRDEMIKGWKHLKGFDVRVATYVFNKQYRMLNDYVFDIGTNHGNIYKDFTLRFPNVRLEFIDIGMILMYKEREYTKLCKALGVKELSTTTWKNYVNQYKMNQLIVG